MKLKPTLFRVLNYRNVDDSGWIPLGNITALVGENDSGKSALLRALQKFSPKIDNPFELTTEYPRARFGPGSDSLEQEPVCCVEFQLSREFRQKLGQEVSNTPTPKKVTGIRYYGGQLILLYDESRLKDIPLANELTVDPDRVRSALQSYQASLQEQVAELQRSPGIVNDAIPLEAHLEWVQEKLRSLDAAPSQSSSAVYDMVSEIHKEVSVFKRKRSDVRALSSELAKELRKLRGGKIAYKRMPHFDDQIIANLPPFIYFDEYGVTEGTICLPEFSRLIQDNPNDMHARATMALFKIANINVERLVQLSEEEVARAQHTGHEFTTGQKSNDQQRMTGIDALLGAASNTLTNKFNEFYTQREYAIKYRPNGQYVHIVVSDDRNPNNEIALKERSTGFRWYFSFFTVFSAESSDLHRDAVLLIDEPALHLHPTAQQDLLRFMRSLSKDNVILYTTHSPYMIEEGRGVEIRTVVEDANRKPKVNVKSIRKDLAAVFPYNATTGSAIVRYLFKGVTNILVEGLSDHLYLCALSEQCRRAERDCLPERICIVPCCGTRNFVHQAKYAIGHGVRPLVLLDGDPSGVQSAEALQKELYAKTPQAIMSINDVLGQGMYEIEDIIGEQVIIPELKKMIDGSLKWTMDADNKKPLCRRIGSEAAKQKVPLPDNWKSDVAWEIGHKWLQEGKVVVPSDTLDRGHELFQMINQRQGIVQDIK